MRPTRQDERPLLNDLDRQIDVIYPSSQVADQIDEEIVNLLLTKRGITIESAAAEDENEYFRRRTMLLKDVSGRDSFREGTKRIDRSCLCRRHEQITRFTCPILPES